MAETINWYFAVQNNWIDGLSPEWRLIFKDYYDEPEVSVAAIHRRLPYEGDLSPQEARAKLEETYGKPIVRLPNKRRRWK
jgi:hypothetical protein